MVAFSRQILTIPVKAVIAVGTLSSAPKHIVLPPSFPVRSRRAAVALNAQTVVTCRASLFPGKGRPSELQHPELFYTESEAATDPLPDRRHTLLLQAAPQQQRRAGAQAQDQGSPPPPSASHTHSFYQHTLISFPPSFSGGKYLF